MRQFIYPLIICFVLIYSCSGGANGQDFDSGKYHPRVYPNYAYINDTLSYLYKLPATSFTIEYSNDVSMDYHNDKLTYLSFVNKENATILEEMKIGYTSLKKCDSLLALYVLNEASNQLKATYPKYSESYLGRKTINGIKQFVLEGEVDLDTSYVLKGYVGKYYCLLIVPVPRQDKINAVIISIMSKKGDINNSLNSESKIKGILSTFEYR